MKKSKLKLVASKKDEAGTNIGEKCERLGLNVHYLENDILYPKDLLEAEAYIFLSRHKSKSKKPCLTAHFPGNFSNDDSYGGKPRELGVAYPSLEKKFIKELSKVKKSNKSDFEKYQIVLEATHHGPTRFEEPVTFVEIGSSEREWKDDKIAEHIASAIKETLRGKINSKKKGIAFGGNHYPKKFTNLIRDEEYSIGHIMPKYMREKLDEQMFNRMIEKSEEEINYCIIDKKGCNRKSEIRKMAKKYNLEVVEL